MKKIQAHSQFMYIWCSRTANEPSSIYWRSPRLMCMIHVRCTLRFPSWPKRGCCAKNRHKIIPFSNVALWKYRSFGSKCKQQKMRRSFKSNPEHSLRLYESAWRIVHHTRSSFPRCPLIVNDGATWRTPISCWLPPTFHSKPIHSNLNVHSKNTLIKFVFTLLAATVSDSLKPNNSNKWPFGKSIAVRGYHNSFIKNKTKIRLSVWVNVSKITFIKHTPHMWMWNFRMKIKKWKHTQQQQKMRKPIGWKREKMRAIHFLWTIWTEIKKYEPNLPDCITFIWNICVRCALCVYLTYTQQ